MALTARDKPWQAPKPRGKPGGAHGRQLAEDKNSIQAERNRSVNARWYRQVLSQAVCAYCRNYTPSDGRTRDHVVALCLGGQTTPENIVMACKGCNSAKNSQGFWGMLEVRVRKTRRAEVVAAICRLTGLREDDLRLLHH